MGYGSFEGWRETRRRRGVGDCSDEGDDGSPNVDIRRLLYHQLRQRVKVPVLEVVFLCA